jgi:hypothetical protein
MRASSSRRAGAASSIRCTWYSFHSGGEILVATLIQPPPRGSRSACAVPSCPAPSAPSHATLRSVASVTGSNSTHERCGSLIACRLPPRRITDTHALSVGSPSARAANALATAAKPLPGGTRGVMNSAYAISPDRAARCASESTKRVVSSGGRPGLSATRASMAYPSKRCSSRRPVASSKSPGPLR